MYSTPTLTRFGTFRDLTKDYYCQYNFAASGHKVIPPGCERIICHDFGVCNAIGRGSPIV